VVPLGRRAESLSKAINRVVYTAWVPPDLARRAAAALNGDGADLDAAARHRRLLARLLERDAIPHERVRETKTKTVDLRPFLLDLELDPGGDLRLHLGMDNGRTAKPHEILSILYGEGSEEILVTRLEQLVARGDKNLSPLLVAGRETGGAGNPG
jgi:hypothetical protein